MHDSRLYTSSSFVMIGARFRSRSDLGIINYDGGRKNATTAVEKNATGARCPFMVLGPIFVEGPWTDFCGSKVPTTGARCPFIVLGPIFVGVRCPFMVLGLIFVRVRCLLREQGARYGPRTDLCGSNVPTTGARCPLWSSNRSLWEQGAHYGSKVPARSSNRSVTTAVGKNATTEKSEKTKGVRCPLGPRTDLLRRWSEKTLRP
nr:hypothetical protein Iba_scaffold28120CG0010 [Ipomoea batatas]